MPQLRVVVTGDTNSGKSTLTNAVIGRELLPTSSQSETSVITYVVPLQVGEGCATTPVLHCYHDSKLQPVAEGDEAVKEYLDKLNHGARSALGTVQCVECRLDCPLRDSLNVFVPAAAEWQDVQFLDIGGANEILNPAVQICADLAYALSHRLIVCVRHDQITSRSTQQLLLEIRAKAPYHFSDDVARSDRCPLIFAITQVDQALDDEPGEKWEVLRQSLRAVLHRTLTDCVELSQKIPIILVSAKNSLQALQSGTRIPQYEWQTFEELLINTAGLKRDIIRESKVRRASFIHELLKENLLSHETSEAWPYNAQCLWHSRRDFGKKLAIGSAVAAGSVGTALAFGVFLSASSAAAVAAAEAGAASAEATAAAAAANSWWAWAFGFGQFSAAATAASGAAATAEAAAATAAATASAWGLGSAIAGASTAGLTIAASSGASADGVSHIAGMTVVHASAVRVRDVRLAFRGFKSNASADRIKAGKTYRDVLFYPDDTAKYSRSQDLGLLPYPFLLRHRKSSAYLTFDGAQVHASSARDRPGQLWWAVPDERGEFVLQNAEHLCNLRLEEASWFSPDRRMAVRCTAEVPGQTWTLGPGFEDGSIALRHVKLGHQLYYDGFFLGAFNEAYEDQDWQVLPQVPFYIGGFKEMQMSGRGQFFWPNGAPLFKGTLKAGKLVDGFVFDERCICHGHFKFGDDEEEPQLAGLQPEDAMEGQAEALCQVCKESPNMASMGKAFKPCNHGGTCESCAGAVRECPYCRSPVEGVHRVT